MVDINIPKIVKSYVPLHRSTPLNTWKPGPQSKHAALYLDQSNCTVV